MRHHVILSRCLNVLEKNKKIDEELYKELKKVAKELTNTPEGKTLEDILKKFKKVDRYYTAKSIEALKDALKHIVSRIEKRILEQGKQERKIEIRDKELLSAIPKSLEVIEAKEYNGIKEIIGQDVLKKYATFELKIEDKNNKRKVTIIAAGMREEEIPLLMKGPYEYAAERCIKELKPLAECIVYHYGDILEERGTHTRVLVDLAEAFTLAKKKGISEEKVKNEVRTFLEEQGCVCTESDFYFECECTKNPIEEAADRIMKYWEKEYDKEIEREKNTILDFYNDFVKDMGKKVGCECSVEFVRETGWGIQFDVICKCEREYKLTPEEKEKSYKDLRKILETLDSLT